MRTRSLFLSLIPLLACSPLLSDEPAVKKPAANLGQTLYSYTPKDYSSLLGMPGFSDQLLKMHFQLYEGYVKNTNLLLTTFRSMLNTNKTQSYEYGALKRRLGWEFDGMRLHEYYFDNLGGKGEIDSNSPVLQQMARDFGSYEKWKKDFISTGLMRGVGWAILYKDPQTGHLMNMWINEHDLGHLAGGDPLLVMDVWEHAFITEYGLDRAKYIEAFFNNIDWSVVDKRYSS